MGEIRLVHVIPRDGIGGVEVAARSMLDGPRTQCETHIVFIAGKTMVSDTTRVSVSPYQSENNPLAHLHALRRLLELRPHVIVCSLWRSIPVCLLAKLFRRKMRLVFFLHSAKTIHILDAALSRLMLAFCDMVWGDSEATILSRVQRQVPKPSRVISFVTSDTAGGLKENRLEPRFVFWGRLHQHKGLDRAIDLVRRLCDRGVIARYEIWGPDDGEYHNLVQRVKQINLTGAVAFKGEADPRELDDIASRHCFFLQLSRVEGMAMAVVEAMQRSLVPIVTPVGEISRYCRDGENAIVVDLLRMDDTVSAVIQLLESEEQYRRMQAAAREFWRQRRLYREDICAAAVELLSAG